MTKRGSSFFSTALWCVALVGSVACESCGSSSQPDEHIEGGAGNGKPGAGEAGAWRGADAGTETPTNTESSNGSVTGTAPDGGTGTPGSTGTFADGGTAADGGAEIHGNGGTSADGGTAADGGAGTHGNGGTSADGGTGTHSDAGGMPSVAGPPPPSFSCLEVMNCIAKCPEEDEDACTDACDERGTAEAQMHVLAVTTCFDEEECEDETCFADTCAVPFDACIVSSRPEVGGSPLEEEAPPGSVPSDLVGTWGGAWDGNTQELTFNADGSGSWRSSRTWDEFSCLSASSITRTGNIVVDSKYITMYASSIVRSEHRCSPPSTVDTNEPPVMEKLQWHRDENPAEVNTIFVVEDECAARFPGTEDCDSFTCPIHLYCTIRVLRQ